MKYFDISPFICLKIPYQIFRNSELNLFPIQESIQGNCNLSVHSSGVKSFMHTTTKLFLFAPESLRRSLISRLNELRRYKIVRIMIAAVTYLLTVRAFLFYD